RHHYQMSSWSPYVNNGGTALAIAGPNFAIVAADTRLSAGYSILSRHTSRITKLTNQCFIVSCGQSCEVDKLQYEMTQIVQDYVFEHKMNPSLNAIAQKLSLQLYSRRFFPYYAFNLLAGISDTNSGIIYSYDSIGNTEPLKYGTTGSSASAILPIVDLYFSKIKDYNEKNCIELIKDCFKSAAERDILTGDSVEIFVIRNNKEISKQVFPLRND
uniref:Proteasome subunit beta type-1-like n=1 Tax=Dermatophagoides pteronyssinus TaxID=6956 RepID=A0A6P6YAV7_DERPT